MFAACASWQIFQNYVDVSLSSSARGPQSFVVYKSTPKILRGTLVDVFLKVFRCEFAPQPNSPNLDCKGLTADAADLDVLEHVPVIG